MPRQYQCECGESMVVDFRWNGHVWVCVFRSNKTGERITHCPRCGDQLRLLSKGGKDDH